MLTENKISELRQEAGHILRTISENVSGTLDEIRQKNNIRVKEDPRIQSEESKLDDRSIQFDVSCELDSESPNYTQRIQQRSGYRDPIQDD